MGAWPRKKITEALSKVPENWSAATDLSLAPPTLMGLLSRNLIEVRQAYRTPNYTSRPRYEYRKKP